MKLDELVILLPCHSLEDFPVYLEGDQADGILACWSALWHPALLAAAGKTPNWYRADGTPEHLPDRLILIPQASEAILSVGWTQRVREEGAVVIQGNHPREQLVQRALEELGIDPSAVSNELAADFMALGTSYLLLELLTRQMRYMSNIDTAHLQNQAVKGASAAMAGDVEVAQQALKNCQEVLLESRERFYPVNAYLIDIVLTAESTLGASLQRELTDVLPKSILITGDQLKAMSQSQPQTLFALREAIDRKTATVIGGSNAEHALPLMPVEHVLRDFVLGLASFQRELGTRPKVYGRRTSGLTPLLPMVLSRLGYSGALHFTLDHGQFPSSNYSKTRWEGLGECSIDAITKLPFDASKSETMLGFPRKLGESMDRDHVAALLFVHWPDTICPAYADVRRVSRHVPVFGKFVTLDDFFANTQAAGEVSNFSADKYRTGCLDHDLVQARPNPISRVADAWQSSLHALSAETLSTLAATLTGQLEPREQESALVESSQGAAAQGAEAANSNRNIEESSRRKSAERFAAAIAARDEQAPQGLLIINPSTVSRGQVIDVSTFPALPPVAGPVLEAEETNSLKQVRVEVPPMGYAWVGAASPGVPTSEESKNKGWFGKKKRGVNIVEGHVLRNEFMEVHLHEQTGGIRAIYDFVRRSSLVTQQLSLRSPGPQGKPGEIWREPDEVAEYATMSCQELNVEIATTLVGQILSRGELLNAAGTRVAGFEQRFRLCKGDPVLEIVLKLDVNQEPRPLPWESYYASRLAWASESAEIRRGVFGTRQTTGAKKIEAPQFVEIVDGSTSVGLLTGGLPYHKRVGPRMLDTLLVARGETRREFRMGLAINAASLPVVARDFDLPLVTQPSGPPRSGPTHAWLFMLDAKNVIATHWQPVEKDRRVVGLRARFLETMGKRCRATLTTPKRPASARQVSFCGESILELKCGETSVTLELGANEWIDVEINW